MRIATAVLVGAISAQFSGIVHANTICPGTTAPCDARFPGDFDRDGDVDRDDLDEFATCVMGPTPGPFGPNCGATDIDDDDDTDLADFAKWQALQTGSCDCPPLIAEPPNGQQSNPMRGVYLFSGESKESVVDLTIQGRGTHFTWGRKYRSRIGPNTELGNGWDYSYNIRLEAVGSHLRLRDGNTRRDVYRLQGDGTWTRPEFFTVISQDRGGTCKLTFPDKRRWTFNPLNGSPGAGKIAEMADRYGNAMTFTYDEAGRLIVIHDSLDTATHNRDIVIAYNRDGLIESVTDFIGRQVKYEYYQDGDAGGSAGDLKSVTTPAVIGTPTANDFPKGKTTTYTYSNGFADDDLNHNLLTITDPKGQLYLQNVYATTTNPNDIEFDHVVRQIWGDAGDILDVSYVPRSPAPGNNFATMLAIVNDRVGNVEEHYFDDLHRCVMIREYTGRSFPDLPTTDTLNRPQGKLRTTDPDFFETRYTFNTDDLVTSILHPNGNEEELRYDDENHNPRSRGNLLQHCTLPGPLGGDQIQICKMFEYDPAINFDTNQVTRSVDARLNETQYQYDSAGNRTRITHRIPSIVEDFEYNGFGQLTAHVNPDNGSNHRRRDEFVYYDSGPSMGYLRQTIVDAGARALLNLTTTYEYDAVGNITRLIDPRGNDTLRTYNALDELVKTESRPVNLPAGTVRYVSTFHFDANGNLVRFCRQNVDEQGIVDPSNAYLSMIMEYDLLDVLTRSCEESGSFDVPLSPPKLDCGGLPESEFVTTEYEYDESRNQTRVRFGEAVERRQSDNEIVRLYDERDLLFQETRAPGHTDRSTSQTDYDGNGNLSRTHEGLEDDPRITNLVYDGYDRITSSTDPMGNVTEFLYDANGNQTKRRAKGELIDDVSTGGSNILLEETTFQFDDMDRNTRIIGEFFQPDAQGPIPIGDGKSNVRLFHSRSGHLIMFEDDNDRITRFSYDTANRKHVVTDAKGNTTTYDYDANSNVSAITEAEKSDLGSSDETFVTTYAYDALDRLTHSTDNVGNVDQHHYDSRDNVTRTVDAVGNVARYMYDALNRLTATERDLTDTGDGTGSVIGTITTTREWDDSHRLTTETDDNGHTTTYVYDALGRITTTEFADCTTDNSVYDVHDNEIETTDANGSAASYTYDLLNRRIESTYTPGAGVSSQTLVEAFAYDGLSRLKIAEDDDSVSLFEYDSLGNVLSQDLNGHVTASAYDGVGNKLSCTYPGGRILAYTYDSLNRISTIGDTFGNVLSTYKFIGPDRIERMDYANSTGTQYTYNGHGDPPNRPDDFGVRRMIGTQHFSAGGHLIDERTYKWDKNYNKTQRVDVTPGRLATTHDFAYDSVYRLTQTTVSAPPPINTIRDTDYECDDVYNRVRIVENGATETYTRSSTLCEPADFQMNQYTFVGTGNRLHDANGNTRRIGPGVALAPNFVYDVHNQLVQYTSPTGNTTTYTYDAFGRRLSKTVNIVVALLWTEYLWGDDPDSQCNFWQVLEERRNVGSSPIEYIYGGGLDDVLHMTAGGDDYFFHADDLGNIMALTDRNGALVERYAYDDYGVPQFFNASGNPVSGSQVGNPYLFTGRRYDSETGLYYFRRRYYDPRSGRFTSRDPLGIWGDAANAGNAYAYTGNNPWTHTDAMGMARSTKPREIVVVGSKVKDVIKEAGLRSDGELVQASIARNRNGSSSSRGFGFVEMPPSADTYFKGYRPQFYFRTTDVTGTAVVPGMVQRFTLFAQDGTPVNIKPLHDRILVRRVDESDGSEGSAASGLPTGKRQHKPVNTTKPQQASILTDLFLSSGLDPASSTSKRKQSLYFPESMLDLRAVSGAVNPPAPRVRPLKNLKDMVASAVGDFHKAWPIKWEGPTLKGSAGGVASELISSARAARNAARTDPYGSFNFMVEIGGKNARTGTGIIRKFPGRLK